MDDHAIRKALMRDADTANVLEADIKSPSKGPIAQMMAFARTQAGEALRGLIDVDPTDAKAVERLQTEVRRYQEMADWIRVQFLAGVEAWEQLDAQDRAELEDLVNERPDT